jgi:mRNA interferase MazF
VVHVVPLTSTVRRFHSEITIEPDAENGLTSVSAAQCQHVRAISPRRILTVVGNVGTVVLAQIRETIAVLLDVPMTVQLSGRPRRCSPGVGSAGKSSR